MEPTNKHINLKGLDVHYVVQGSGPALVLMHGWGCNSSTVASIAKVAAETHTVYSLDLPGFGTPGAVPVLSEEPKDVWGAYDYADLLSDFVGALALERPTLIGHSYGGRVAIIYGSTSDVDKIVLVDAAGVKPRRSLKYYAKVYSFKFAKWLAPKLLGRDRGQRMIDAWRSKSGSADYNRSSPMMRAILSKSVNEDLTHLMPMIKAPTLLVWGENDTATPISDAKKMERLIPGSGLVAFPACGHYSFLDNPTQFAAVLRSFLKS